MRCFAAAVLVGSCVVTGCASSPTRAWWDEHTDARTWKSAGSSFASDPWQWGPAATLAAATPLLLPFDQQNTTESVDDRIFGTHEIIGDWTAVGLGIAPLAWGLSEALSDDDPRFLEVSSETAALTFASTYALKYAVNRSRPGGQGQDSFPSGHSSFAFAGATLAARRWADTHDGSVYGYLLYLPAGYVGLSRLEGERHWLSDITFGAALGVAMAHLVYDAHYGDEVHEGLFRRRSTLRADFGPLPCDEGAAFGLSLSF